MASIPTAGSVIVSYCCRGYKVVTLYKMAAFKLNFFAIKIQLEDTGLKSDDYLM